MSGNHSPGPWRVWFDPKWPNDFEVVDVCGHTVALMAGSNPNGKPDAELIARAPELAADVARVTAERDEFRALLERFIEAVSPDLAPDQEISAEYLCDFAYRDFVELADVAETARIALAAARGEAVTP